MGTPPTFPTGSTPGQAALQFALDPPRASVSTNSTSLPDDVSTVITFTSLKWDTDGMWNAGNPTRLTVQTPGLYSITVISRLPSAVYGRHTLNPRINAGGAAASGTSIIAFSPVNATVTGTANTTLAHSLTLDQPLSAGDYLELFVQQKSGATRVVDAALMFMRWVAYL